MMGCMVHVASAQTEGCSGTQASFLSAMTGFSPPCNGTCTEEFNSSYPVWCVTSIDPTTGQYACTYCMSYRTGLFQVFGPVLTGTCGMNNELECTECNNWPWPPKSYYSYIANGIYVTEPCSFCGGDNISFNSRSKQIAVAGFGLLFLPLIALPRLARRKRVA